MSKMKTSLRAISAAISLNRLLRRGLLAMTKKTILAILAIVVIGVPLLYLTVLNQKEAKASWFNEDWLYRQAVTITVSSSASDVTNLATKISVDTASLTTDKLQSDCDDLRFTNIKGDLLPFYIDSGCDTSTTKIWVMVDLVPKNTTTYTMYMYYGNPSAVSGSTTSNGLNLYQGLAAYWNMNESSWNGTANEIKDLSGNANNSARTGNATTTTGKFGNGGTFDGAGDYISVADSNSLNVTTGITNKITVSAWVNRAATFPNPEGFVVARWGGGANSYILYVANTTWVAGWVLDAEQNLTSTTALSASTWYHIVGTYDGSQMKIYVNGVSENSQNRTGNLTSGAGTTTIGQNPASERYFNGLMDDVRIYNRDLSATEVSQLYNDSASSILTASQGQAVPTPAFATEEKGKGPVGYWKFDDGQGTVAKDSTSSKNNSTFINNASWQTEDQCISGKCVKMPADTDYLRLTASAGNALNLGSSDFTIMGWLKVFQPETYGSGLLGNYPHSGNNGDLSIGISDDRTTLFLNHRNTSGTYESYGGFNYSSYFGKWVQMSWVKSGSSLYLYLNGEKKKTWDITISFDVDFYDDYWYIGNTGWSPGTMSNLMVDEHKIYNYARTAAEIKTDYNAGKANATANSGTSAALGSQPQEFMSQGLVGYWKMDEASWNGTASEVVDSSGNGNNGTSSCDGGGCSKPTTATGKYGNGASLNGTSQYVTSGNGSSLSFGTGSFTIAGWVNSSTTGAWQTIVDKRATTGGNQVGYSLNLHPTNNKLMLALGDGSGALGETNDTTTLSQNTWYYVAAVMDRTTNMVSYYINGALSSSASYSTVTGSANNSSNLMLSKTTLGTNYFSGKLDEIRVYNRALSSKEVSDLYNWAPGPVGYWDFEEGSGTSVKDKSTNANTGTLGGDGSGTDIPTWKPGKYGTGLNFDGSDDYVDMGNQAIYKPGSGSFTVMAWVKSTVNQAKRIVTIRDAATPRTAYDIYSSSDIYRFDVADGTNAITPASSGISASDGKWHHITGVIDRDSNLAILYVDGVKQNSGSISGFGAITPDASLIIGNFSTSWWSGQIDEVKIYNYARTAKQVVEDMNAGHPAVGTPVGSAVGHWKFDEGQGTTANDSTLNANTLTLSSASWTNSGKFGKAWNGDGAKWLSKADDADFDFTATESFAVSLWYKTDSANNPGATEYLLNKGPVAASAAGYAIYANASGNLCFAIDDDTTWDPDVTSCTTTDLYDGAWHHVIGIRDVAADKTMIYIDGVLKDSDTDTTSATLANSSSLYIGDSNGADGGDEFNGDIDEVKIYRFALTADQVKTEFNRGQSMQLGALGNNAASASNAASQEYCVPGDTTSCAPPLAEYDFEEKNGTSTSDRSGNGYTGTLVGATWTNGKKGSGLFFDGASATKVSSAAPVSTNFTWEVWLYRDTTWTSGEREMMSREYQTQFTVNGNNVLRLQAGGNGSALGTTTIVPGRWYHAAATYDGTTVKVYLNGVLEGQNNITVNDGTATLYTGWYDTSGTYNWKGKLDQVKVFNYARSAAQIAYDYNRGGPVGWWKMDECQGDRVNDSSGNGNNGTITIGGSGSQSTGGTCTTPTDGTGAWYNGATGKRNSSLNFDGTDDYINIADNSILRPGSGDWSVSVWAKPANSDQTSMMVGKRQASGDYEQWGMSICGESGCSSGGQQLQAIFRTSATSERRALSSADVADGNWHHYTMVVSQSDNKIRLYKDGTELATSLTTTGSWPTVDNTDALRIGDGNGSLGFSGQVDDVKIFNYALTSTQVKDVYNGGAVNFGPVTGSP